jgi:spore photoproduct lyase
MVLDIIRHFPYARRYEIDDHRRLDDSDVPLKGFTQEVKRTVLVLARNPGGFIREFQRQGDTCGRKEFFIAHANGCPFDCQYCFLQCYFSHSAPVLFVNQDHLFEELVRHVLEVPQGTIYHAGELSDALALETLSGFAARALSVFGRYPQVALDLRTKCASVESLLPSHPPENIVVSWTLSPDRLSRELELGTPPIEERIRSAVRCQAKGYWIGIRLDPIVRYQEWETGYAELIQCILTALDPQRIDSFILGAFRYLPALATRIRMRFPNSHLLLDEFVPCIDGKFRYFRPLRVELYRRIVREIRRLSANIPITLCMETDQVWSEVQGLHKKGD